MTLSGCLILEVLQTYPYTSSFSTLTQDLLRTPMICLNNIMVCLVAAILLYAYISSAGHSSISTLTSWYPMLRLCLLPSFLTRSGIQLFGWALLAVSRANTSGAVSDRRRLIWLSPCPLVNARLLSQ
ncbi:hypothetical protein L1D52_19885 [Vibrio brasiliensis]|uniref:aromatic amino acid transport family protein n=1 Tax=Vibrio brasiliensis TaxID=170652 RepID=UPI001EFDB2D1|nr:aromatic amino acid transport family protein [Vibrio brasiliensis]MCG9784613.1 hypothetical protein [Vibrio brasiliensis]